MMATATLVIVILGFGGCGTVLFLIWREMKRQSGFAESHRRATDLARASIELVRSDIESIRDVLTKASAIKAQKQESVFDRDTITPTNQKPRYVSLAIRRAQAERASLGPVMHDDRVRENNARAMESAG